MCLYHTVSQFHLYSCSKQEPYVTEDPVRHSFLFSFALQYCGIFYTLSDLCNLGLNTAAADVVAARVLLDTGILDCFPEHFCKILIRFERIFQPFESFQIFLQICKHFDMFFLHLFAP